MDDSSPSEGDSDSVMVETGYEPVSNQGEFGTGPELVPEIGGTGIEPLLVFEEDVDDSFLIGLSILRKMKRLRSIVW